MKKVAISQSNYIPWKGYFDLIASVDEFILYDDMQYTKNDWRNRNLIKTQNGVQWMTVPIRKKYKQKIRETEIDGTKWAETHWKTLKQIYSQAPYFQQITELVKPIYLDHSFTLLSDLNRVFITTICNFLGITTKISNSWDYFLIEGKSNRVADLCAQAGGTEYVSGPAGKNYLDQQVFIDRSIKLTWFDYSDYPEYNQLWGNFTHTVSILDLLFNCGYNAPHYMKHLGAK